MQETGTLRIKGPIRETLSTCLVLRDDEFTVRQALDSIWAITDEVIVVDTGSTDDTAGIVAHFAQLHGLSLTSHSPVQFADKRGRLIAIAHGTSPRWCFDCRVEHTLGDFRPGHRLAGFETPRNESIANARGDWILWLDGDEELVNAAALEKYLRQNVLVGYAVPQHHFDAGRDAANVVSFPVRLFRRSAERPPGWIKVGGWPTYDPGHRIRFAGIVHEHPGQAPAYTDGVAPVMVLHDVRIAHWGYSTLEAREERIRRNWPLVVADHEKYPGRRVRRTTTLFVE